MQECKSSFGMGEVCLPAFACSSVFVYEFSLPGEWIVSLAKRNKVAQETGWEQNLEGRERKRNDGGGGIAVGVSE